MDSGICLEDSLRHGVEPASASLARRIGKALENVKPLSKVVRAEEDWLKWLVDKDLHH